MLFLFFTVCIYLLHMIFVAYAYFNINLCVNRPHTKLFTKFCVTMTYDIIPSCWQSTVTMTYDLIPSCWQSSVTMTYDLIPSCWQSIVWPWPMTSYQVVEKDLCDMTYDIIPSCWQSTVTMTYDLISSCWQSIVWPWPHFNVLLQ
jgi:hypothetical protein